MTTYDATPIDVLLVEDDPGDELMTREAFEDNKIGNTLHVVRDGEEALDFLYRRGGHAEAPRPDLILLDLNLPKYDGRQVLEKIKSDQDLADRSDELVQIDDFFVQVVRLPRRPA